MSNILSIIVTAHQEGILLHKTLMSIRRSLAKVTSSNEIIISIDGNDQETIDCATSFKKQNEELNIKILNNDFKDVAKSRNLAIDQAVGKYITFIDGDDIMSEHWLVNALDFLESKPYGQYIAHPEWTVEFGNNNAVIKKHGEISYDTDAMLSVWAGRWNVVLMAPVKLIKQLKYQPNNTCFGFEDWRLSCDLIFLKTHNILIPHTVVFVRRKATKSVWDTHKSNKVVLRASELFRPSNFRKIRVDANLNQTTLSPTKTTIISTRLKEIIKRRRYLFKIAKLAHKIYRKPSAKKESTLPSWLLNEWRQLHKIDKQIFPESNIINYPSFYDSITKEHYRVGQAYYKLCSSLSNDTYDYLLFVPWLVKGGADLFAINYANTMADLGLKVLVFATNLNTPTGKTWQKLNKTIDFININNLINEPSPDELERLLEQLIENTHVRILHILNSVAAYDFVESHHNYLEKTNRKVIVTSYSQSVDSSGKIFGFSHTHVPKVYSFSNLITTDNSELKQMWIEEYGFNPEKIVVHNQMLDVNFKRNHHQMTKKIIWAARIAQEKNPELMKQVAKLLGNNYRIDIFGDIDKNLDFDTKKLPSNLTYKGRFDNIFALPLNDYDLYLYTSLFDGTPNTLIEASLAGLPIISSNVGGTASLLDNTGDILIKDHLHAKAYVEEIKKFYKNFAEHQRLALAKQPLFRQRFSKNNFEKQIKRLLELINYKI